MTTYCSNCGSPVVPGALLCSGCGRRAVALEKNCPTCGQVWPNEAAPQMTTTQTTGLYSQPASQTQAWPAPVPEQAPLSSLPSPTPNMPNLQSFPPPSPAPLISSVRLPNYGKNFVEGTHCGNCGTGVKPGLATCEVCGTGDLGKIPGAEIKSAPVDISAEESTND